MVTRDDLEALSEIRLREAQQLMVRLTSNFLNGVYIPDALLYRSARA